MNTVEETIFSQELNLLYEYIKRRPCKGISIKDVHIINIRLNTMGINLLNLIRCSERTNNGPWFIDELLAQVKNLSI
jgi:hypothetical protein